MDFSQNNELDVKEFEKKELDIAIFSTSADPNKVKNIVNSIYRLSNTISIANWHLYVPEQMNKDSLETNNIVIPQKEFHSSALPLGFILMPIRQIDFFDGYKIKRVRYSYIFQIINKFHHEISDQLDDIKIGYYLIDIISSRRINSLDLKSQYTWEEMVKDGGSLALPHIDKRLHYQSEIKMHEEFFILYQKSQRGDVFVKKIKMKANNNLVNLFNDKIKENNNHINRSLSNFHINQINYENLYSNLEEIAFKKTKFLDFDNIIVLNNEIDEGHYSNPVEDHDMINMFNFFTYLFNDPPSVMRKIENEKGIELDRNFKKDRNNDAMSGFLNDMANLSEEFDKETKEKTIPLSMDNIVDALDEKTDEYKNFYPENAPSYITEINSYKSKLLLQDFKSNLALPFKGVDLIETNSLSSKVLASAFYDTKNHLLMEYLFEKINYLKSYDVFNKEIRIKISELKSYFAKKNETFIGYIDYEYESFYKGGTRKIRNFYINPANSKTADLNRGDKIIVISNYHESSFQGQSDWEDLFSLI